VWTDELDEASALGLLRDCFPDLANRRVETIHDGWDTHAFLIDRSWIGRVPRRLAAEESLRREVELLPRIAPSLPSPVPTAERVSESRPLCVLTPRIAGTPATGQLATARELGRFLRSLHELPLQSLPIPAATVTTWRRDHERRRAQFEEHVFPLLAADERHAASRLFASVQFDFEPRLVHGDLGPEHVLCARDGRIAGIIDWGDARAGDPAIDLAWALHGAGRAFARGVVAAYGPPDSATRARAAFYHRRGPWYEVLYGLERGQAELVASGLARVRERLR
jgi:aminoglycoside phosphotransferase (APT) family kinase protein